MENYEKIKKEHDENKLENEVRVTTDRYISKYLNIAEKILGDEKYKELVIKATGNAISNAVSLAE